MRLEPQDGSAAVESIFAMVFLLLLTLGAVQVAFTLYGRNVIAASAHEGARTAIELGRNPSESAALARRTVEQSAGGLVRGLTVMASVDRVEDRSIVRVTVRGTLQAFGPIPVSIPITARATSTREIVGVR